MTVIFFIYFLQNRKKEYILEYISEQTLCWLKVMAHCFCFVTLLWFNLTHIIGHNINQHFSQTARYCCCNICVVFPVCLGFDLFPFVYTKTNNQKCTCIKETKQRTDHTAWAKQARCKTWVEDCFQKKRPYFRGRRNHVFLKWLHSQKWYCDILKWLGTKKITDYWSLLFKVWEPKKAVLEPGNQSSCVIV